MSAAERMLADAHPSPISQQIADELRIILRALDREGEYLAAVHVSTAIEALTATEHAAG